MTNKLKENGPKITLLRKIYDRNMVGYGYPCSREGYPPFKDKTIRNLIKRGLLRHERKWYDSWFGHGHGITLLYVTSQGAKSLGGRL